MDKRFTIEEHLRWSDIDRAGIIYYGQFLRFFEIAETELFRSVGLSYSEVFDKLDIWLPRVQRLEGNDIGGRNPGVVQRT